VGGGVGGCKGGGAGCSWGLGVGLGGGRWGRGEEGSGWGEGGGGGGEGGGGGGGGRGHFRVVLIGGNFREETNRWDLADVHREGKKAREQLAQERKKKYNLNRSDGPPRIAFL